MKKAAKNQERPGSRVPLWRSIQSKYAVTYLFIVAIIVLVLAFNFFGDGVRDALDPKLK